jgi:uncharacterized membrane protein
MTHDGADDRSDQVSEPGHGDDKHQRGQPDTGRGSQGAEELGNPRGAELARRRRRDPNRDAQASEAEVTPPPNQPTLPGFDAAVISYSRSGPLPTAAELAEYDRFMPGLAREIVNQAHANMESDRTINELRVQTASKLDIRGQGIAATLSATCILFALLCLFRLHPEWLAVSGAGIFGLGAVAPVINAFLQRGGPTRADDSEPPPQPPTSPPDD